jgi:hypothetical protein
MAEKRKKSLTLTPEEVETIRASLEEIRRDLRQMLAILQSKVGQKPA